MSFQTKGVAQKPFQPTSFPRFLHCSLIVWHDIGFQSQRNARVVKARVEVLYHQMRSGNLLALAALLVLFVLVALPALVSQLVYFSFNHVVWWQKLAGVFLGIIQHLFEFKIMGGARPHYGLDQLHSGTSFTCPRAREWVSKQASKWMSAASWSKQKRAARVNKWIAERMAPIFGCSEL